MADKEKKRKLLKAKIAVALQDEYKRVPTTEEIDSVFHLTRVCTRQCWGCTTSGLSRKSPDSLPCFTERIARKLTPNGAGAAGRHQGRRPTSGGWSVGTEKISGQHTNNPFGNTKTLMMIGYARVSTL